MDYQLNIIPSSERDMQNIKADNPTKQIKILQETKLPAVYKSVFGTAVRKFNERAMSGRLIDNYYQSIKESNIPEVYKLRLSIRYELLNKSDIVAISKAFTAFKKLLDKQKYIKTVSSYLMTYDEYKDLIVFFVPICDNYQIGLSTRNDLIDLVKQLKNIENPNMNVLEAMPIFISIINDLFATVNKDQFLTQEELEAKAKNIGHEIPEEVHAIALEALQHQIQQLKNIESENQQYEVAIEAEKQRIAHDIEWVKTATKNIHDAEIKRLKDEVIKAEAARKADAARQALEAQRREEERLAEENRRLEAARLAEQAKRNLLLMQQMSRQPQEVQMDEYDIATAVEDTEMHPVIEEKRIDKDIVKIDQFLNLLEMHLQWTNFYQITDEIEYQNLSKDAMKDPRRLNLVNCQLDAINFNDYNIIGATFKDCEFSDCDLSGSIAASRLDNCKLLNTKVHDLTIKNCVINNVDVERLIFENVSVLCTTVMLLNAKNATFNSMMSSPANTFIRCDFTEAVFENCDMKKNNFSNCSFINSAFTKSDLRNSSFQVCQIEKLKTTKSLFKNVQIT